MYKYIQVAYSCVQYTVKLYLQNTHLMCEMETHLNTYAIAFEQSLCSSICAYMVLPFNDYTYASAHLADI